jgi:hypothetical protein
VFHRTKRYSTRHIHWRNSSVSETHRWAHNVHYEHLKGRTRAVCVCGWQTGWMDGQNAVMNIARIHTGLKEYGPKPAKGEEKG